MTPVPELQLLARLVGGRPREALRRLLTLVCQQLDMDLAFVSVLDDEGNRTVVLSARADGSLGPADLTEPLSATWCGRVIGDGGLITADATADPALQALALTTAFSIVSYAGVPLLGPDGSATGTLCALGHTPHESLNRRDHAALVTLAEVIAPLVDALDVPDISTPVRADLATLSNALDAARDVEQLTRPLLDALHDLTGMASTYLTVVHEDDGVQEIRYARNTSTDFALPEGLLVPWDDTLCKRSLDEGRACTTNVPEVWGDSLAAQGLGIQVYISVPVRMSDGTLWGTLCAADAVAAEGVEAHLPTMRLFARLVGAQAEREAAEKRAQQTVDIDALTGCARRRLVQPWLYAQLSELAPGEVLVAAYVNMDSFRDVNNRYGEEAGDAVLAEVGRRLLTTARPDDLVARLGGDEFLVVARVPRTDAASTAAHLRGAIEFRMPWEDGAIEVRATVGVAYSDGYDGPSLVAAADTDAYFARHPL